MPLITTESLALLPMILYFCTLNQASQNCEELRIPMCQSLGYNLTTIPNILGHQNQDEAGLELHQFAPLIKVGCSPDLKWFLCSVYAPKCLKTDGKTVLPRRSLCENVRRCCEPLMQKFGFQWPDNLNCDKFPAKNSMDNSSVRYDIQTSTESINSSNGEPEYPLQETQCEELTIPLCRDLDYNLTSLPNLLGHQNQDEAGLELHQFAPLIEIGCSPDLKWFLCSVYAPKCLKTHRKSVLPRRSLCESARRGCEPLMQKFGFSWPDNLNCDKFQSKNSTDNSSVRYEIHTSTESINNSNRAPEYPLQETQCEELTIRLCKDLDYNLTSLPNLLGHQNQDEAGLELHQFAPLIEIGCSPDLKLFLCSVYAPKCLKTDGKSVLPRRSLCESARRGCEPLMQRFGFHWPDNLNCDKFPKMNSTENSNIKHEIQTSAETTDNSNGAP